MDTLPLRTYIIEFLELIIFKKRFIFAAGEFQFGFQRRMAKDGERDGLTMLWVRFQCHWVCLETTL